MKELPNAFWAFMFVLVACVLAGICLLTPFRENVTMAVVTMASSIVTGAFGYIQGYREGGSHLNNANPTNPAEPGKE